jgi:hypothetical protein
VAGVPSGLRLTPTPETKKSISESQSFKIKRYISFSESLDLDFVYLKTINHDVSGTRPVSVLGYGEVDTYSVGSLRKK